MEVQQEEPVFEYVGFWSRVGASILDTLWMLPIIVVVGYAVYGPGYLDTATSSAGTVDTLMQWLFPLAATLAFWFWRQATPGKMAISARIVDAKTGLPPSRGQLVGRYCAYYLSLLPLGLGMLWVAFDSKKRGWHDLLAGTVVIRDYS